MKHLLVLLLATSFSSALSAQALTGDDVKNQFIQDWTRAKKYTMDYLNAMPADKYSFKAVDSIRSFAQQMLHLASGTFGLIQAATGAQPTNWPGHGLEKSPTAQNRDSVVYYVMASYDFAIQSITNMDPSKLGETLTLGPRKATRFAILEKAFEHQTHHRGQCTIYIRLLGIRPPNEELF